jgi:hypothetical protein
LLIAFFLISIFLFTDINISVILITERNMLTKTPMKKTTKSSVQKPVKKTVKKTASKVTWDDIKVNFERIQKTQDEAWAAIRENQQAHKETEKAIRETQQAVKETQKNIGGLNNSLGSIVEHILTPDLPRKFKKFGFTFNQITTIKYAENVYAEIDALLENGTQAMVVEVKTTLRRADIDDHLLRMEKVRKHADGKGDKRQFMGAIAATITDKATKEYALQKGLFVIEPSGEDVKVTKPMEEPRVW